MTPAERTLRARLGGLATASRYPGAVISAPARRGLLARFEREVDPEGILPEPERARRAEAARKRFYTQLSLKAVQARQRRATQS